MVVLVRIEVLMLQSNSVEFKRLTRNMIRHRVLNTAKPLTWSRPAAKTNLAEYL